MMTAWTSTWQEEGNMNNYSLAKLEICDCSDKVAKLSLSTIYEQIWLSFKMKFPLVSEVN